MGSNVRPFIPPLQLPATLEPAGEQVRGDELLARQFAFDRQAGTEELRGRLLVHLAGADLAAEAAQRFLELSADFAVGLEVGPADGALVEQLERVASCAREMQQALSQARLSPEAIGVIEGEAAALYPSRDTDDKVLLTLWTAANLAEAVARAGLQRIRLNPRSRPAEQAGERLATMLVGLYFDLAGELPPVGQRDWFTLYCTDLGRAVGVVCGARTCRKAALQFKRPGTLHPTRGPAA